MYRIHSEIRRRRRELLEALLSLEADEAAAERTITDRAENKIADQLNLRIPRLAIFESGGTAVAATALSDTEYQFITVLESTGEAGLCIDDLIEFISVWNEDTGDENAAVIASNVNRKLRKAKVPFEIKSRKTDSPKKFAKKYFFLCPQTFPGKHNKQKR